MRKRFFSALLAFCMALTLLPSVAVAASAITVDNEADLITAIGAIDENGTITLGATIPLANTLTIDGTKSFVIDLNGKTLSHISGLTAIQYSGTGTLTVTDSSDLGGGKVEASADNSYAIESAGVGKLIISGRATLNSAHGTIWIRRPVETATTAPVVFEMTGGTVTGSNINNVISNSSETGKVIVTGGTITGGNGLCSQYGEVIVSGGTVTGYLDSAIYAFDAKVTLSGGTIRKIDSGYAGTAIRSASLVISGGSVIIDGGKYGATYARPDLSGYTNYQWRTSSTGSYTLSTVQAYTYAESQKYVEFQPYTPPPATYTVAYHPGTNGTESEVTDTKTQDVALTLRGASFTRGGFTQTGWATTDGGAKAYDLGGSYTANAAIDLYPVWTSGTLVNTEAELKSAITSVAANGTIRLGATIPLASTLAISGSNSFVIDLNGNTLSRNGKVIEYSGTGALTITDSSDLGGGSVETTAASASAIENAGVGKLVISGKAAISSTYEAITILNPGTPFNTVLEITGGTVMSTANSAVSNGSSGQINVTGGTITGSNGIVSTRGGDVIVADGSVTGTSGNAIRSDSGGIYGGTVKLFGGTMEISGSTSAIYCDASSNINIMRGSAIINGVEGAMNKAPILTSYTSYQWRTSSTGDYTPSTTQAYSYNSSHTYVEFKPISTATYTVAYHPGTNGTGSEVTDTKTQDVALTLRGASFTRGGFTQTGWATTDGGAKAYDLGGSYTANAAIDLYPVWTSGTLVNTEAELKSAITSVAANGTIRLGATIPLASTLAISGSNSFVIDLNGQTLSRNGKVIEYSGTGTLTITDSSAGVGGKVETTAASASAIESAGVGNLVISGKATISSAYEAITILAAVTPKATVLEMTGGTVVSTATANSAISNNSYGQVNVLGGTITGGNGIVSTSGGNVVVTGGTVTGTSGNAIRIDSDGYYGGTISLMGGTIEITGNTSAIYCDASSNINIIRGSVIINGTASAMNVAPNLTSYTSYQWRTSDSGDYTPSTTQAYSYDEGHTYVEFKSYTPSNTYTVAYHPGTNGTGSEVTDTKTQDVALTLRGAIFTRGGFTQTGWATTDGGTKAYDLGGSYTANAAIDLYPVWTPAILVSNQTELAAAITDIPENGTIKLAGNITLSSTFILSGGKPFTIDLNGYTLTSSSDRGVFEVNSGTLTIADSSVDKAGKITSTKGYESFGTINVNGGNLVVDSGMVENRNTDSSVHTIAVSAGNVTVNGGNVERNNESGSGHSIYNSGSGTIRANGGVVSGGYIENYNTNGTVTVTGGEVSNDNNFAIYSTGTVNVTGGTVKCTSGSSSNAIVNYDGSVNIGGNGEVIGFNGIRNDSGTVTVTGGTITGSSNYAIFSDDDGSISVSGGQLNSKLSAIYCNGTSSCDIDVTGGALYSDDFFAIYNIGSGDLNVAGTARVEGKTTSSGGAIYYTSSGEFTIGGTAVITSPRSSDTGGTIYLGNNSALNIIGGTVQNTYAGATGNAIFAPNAAIVSIASTSPVIIKGPGAAMTSAPYLTNTVITTAATNINGTDGVVTYNPDNINTYKYLKFEPAEIKPAYSVTYRPGANGTGSETVDAKAIDVALTLRGAIFTRNGYTQTGWASTDGGTKAFELSGSYTANEAITLYPVWTQSPSAPGGSGGGTTSPAGNVVYNDPSIPNATIWLSGSGLSRGDILVTETITSGSNYNAMLKLANSGDILQVYDISLQSGRTSTGSAMYLTFDLTRQYAGQEFTLVHKKADGTFDYLYAKAGADGKVKFGPVYELSPFMLVKGSLLYVPTEEVLNVPKTGDVSNSLLFVLLVLTVCGAGVAVHRRKQA